MAESSVKDLKVQGKYEIYQKDNLFRFQLKASNGEILCHSEGYRTKYNCQNAIETFRKITEDENNFVITKDKRNYYQFKVLNGNRKLMLNGESYNSKSSCQNAVESIKRFAKSTKILVLENEEKEVEAEEEVFNEVKIIRETNGKYELILKDKEYSFCLKASNGVVLLNSPLTYKTRPKALLAIDNIRNLIETGYFSINRDKNKNYQFRLYNDKNRLIVVGETYPNKKSCGNAIQSVCRYAVDAKVIEIKEQ